ncbi:membrane protein [Enterococcus florum]|uniref:Membrane protein n=1 Tax=Enterococcus florum TaxID=2480627 RepID=A0A4P5P9K4_9ENTE|nr:threonine/serine exporter family protein [Enterococcus florum]GCF93004.1 membrane protein [Enterococcus florum]
MNEKDRFDLIYDIGETLLENGAEIKRIESTIRHVADALKLEDFDSFVLINGIFMTARLKDETVQARVKDVPISPINLGRIEEINTLSRRITEGKYTPEEAREQLNRIKQENFSSTPLKVSAYAFGSACFCYIFGGTLWDSIGALFLGSLLAMFTFFVAPKLNMSQIIWNISSSMFVSILACLMVQLIPVLQLTSLVTGGIISLLPGVAVVNGIRYLFDGDYSSGWGQMINALITALCISVGVGMVLRVFNWFWL